MLRVVLIIFLMLNITSCSAEGQEPTHFGKVILTPPQYQLFVATVDRALEKFNVKRYGAAPGLKELKDRDVLFWAYQNREKSKYVALVMSDIKTQGIIEIRVYGQYFEENSIRADFIETIDHAIGLYGGILEPPR